MSERSDMGDFTAAGRAASRERAGALEGALQAVESLDRLADAIDGPTMLALIEEHTALMHADAQAQARALIKGRGQYPDLIQQKVFTNDDGYAGTVFVRRGDWSRKPGTKAPKELPLWLEYGTRRMREARPHLLPALAAARERFNRAVEAMLGRAAA